MRDRFLVRDEACELRYIVETEARDQIAHVIIRLADDAKAHRVATDCAAVNQAAQRRKKRRGVLLRAVEQADVSDRPTLWRAALDRFKLAGVEAIANHLDALSAVGQSPQRLGPFVAHRCDDI